MNMFKLGRQKTPKDLVVQLHNALRVLAADGGGGASGARDLKKAQEDVAKALTSIKTLLTERVDPSSKEAEANSEKARISDALTDISQEIFSSECRNTIPLLLDNIDKIDFECSKFVEHLFTHLMSKKVANRHPAIEYIIENMTVLYRLVEGYNRPEHAISFGGMLREACRHEKIAEKFLWDQRFYDLFAHVHGTAFDVSSDAFTTLKDLLTRHKAMVAKFLEANFNHFFDNYRGLIESENYVTKRQALKLLGELLLDRYNYKVMTLYITNAENLKLIMNALKSRQKQIAFEAFHCFKVFVANPNKPRAVHNILVQNQDRLVEFLQNFQTDRQCDNQFSEEKQYLVKQIRDLRPLPPPPPAAATPASAAAAASADGAAM
ncbi:hypothetical protein BOX15_Mlig032685g1 [Macrostomum lignano]|uniref:Uncharacterized protein n=2 Tax=Macrostomum lignano TaxID=282301 RepID=A0A267E5F2_9PLAT|nr:hypothetical protein BOX15_Mlig032161g1 [Macrostomum lignano]PAA77098.1 hypothetical protein BOX15_Mlig032685g2 [Macrostomum lignano]PAA84099.1 hypothetical protein BOX15_Mlig032685g1 [Macrostomum lignano]